MATLSDVWRNEISGRTGWYGIVIQGVDERASSICNLYLSVVARKTVRTCSSLRYILHVVGTLSDPEANAVVPLTDSPD